MTRYIPPNDAEFLAWMNNFISVLNANLATFGLVAADLTPLTNARNDFQTKLGNFQTAETAYRAASEAKKTARLAAEPLFRQMAQRVNRHPAMTNALRAQLRLTVPKPRQRRGVGPEIPGVRLEVDAGRVVIHFGTNPDDERRNGKPAGRLARTSTSRRRTRRTIDCWRLIRRVRICGSIGVRRSGSVFGWRIGARASATRAHPAPKRP